MKRVLATLALLSAFAVQQAVAQDYVQPPVTVSKDKVRDSEGRLYWSHVVLEKQTLYSIAKAYGVTVSQICDANSDLDLMSGGLKKNTILRIPILGQAKETPAKGTSTKESEQTSEVRQNVKAESAVTPSGEGVTHVVKWYENLDDIAALYGVSAEDIARANNLKGNKVKSRMKLIIPSAGKQSGDTETAQEKVQDKVTADKDILGTIKDKVSEGFNDLFDRISPKKEVSATLIMPFNASGSPSGSSLDFYSGFLLGVRDLGKMGISTDLEVYDAAGGKIPVTSSDLASRDLIIGPVSGKDLGNLLAIDTGKIPVVSPLDHKASSLIPGNRNFIQAPSPYEVQYEDMVNWIKSDFKTGDKVIVFSERGAASNAIPDMFDSLFKNAGVTYTPYSYSILQGRDVGNAIASAMGGGVNRIVIASDSEAFVNDVVRNLNQLAFRKHEIVLYSSSRIRSYNTIDVENLHKLNMHVSLSYFIDYESEDVRRFLMEYRALYGTEPTQFSYQGYDIARFFIASCSEYGRNWQEKIASMDRMQLLQNDFLFAEEENGGFVNQGIRRAIYTADYRIVRSR